MIDPIARWCGYVEAMYYTGKMAYFKSQGKKSDLYFVCHKKEYNPRHNPDQLMDIMDIVIYHKGGKISVQKINNPVMKYINIRTTMVIDGSTYVCEGVDIGTSVIRCVEMKIKNDSITNNLKSL